MFTEILRCIYQSAFLPLAPAADDRIYAYGLYKQSLSISAQMSERQHPDSVLLRLQRAAARQEVLNSIGIPKVAELQNNKWNVRFAFLWHARLLFFFFALWWGTESLAAYCQHSFPLGYHFIVWLDHLGSAAIHAFWDLFPPYN